MIADGVAWAGNLGNFEPEFTGAWGVGKSDSKILFDLASLTKSIVTNSLLADFCARDKIPLQDFRARKAGYFLGTLPENLADISLGDYWDHRSGLVSHISLDPQKRRICFAGNRKEMWAYVEKQIVKEGIGSAPGAQTVYSDLNYWVLGAILESVMKLDLNKIWENFKVKYSLARGDLIFGPLLVNRPVVKTEKRHQAGEVNDDNALFMQQVAPHAGLFGSIQGVWQWLTLMKNWHSENKVPGFFTPEHTHRFWCGWDRPTEDPSQAGEGASAKTVLGHLGLYRNRILVGSDKFLGGNPSN